MGRVGFAVGGRRSGMAGGAFLWGLFVLLVVNFYHVFGAFYLMFQLVIVGGDIFFEDLGAADLALLFV